MADNMEIRVNPLPSRTWNWLKMNDSPLAARPLTVGGKLVVSGLTPGLAWTDGVTPDDRWADVETGMVRELDRLLDKAPAALLTAEPGAHPAEPVVIRWTCPDGGQAADRVLIEAGADSELSVVLVLSGGLNGLGAVQTKVRAAAGGKVRVYAVQMMDGTAVSRCDYDAVCGENARAERVRLELGGAQGYTGVYTRLDGDNSEFAADAGYHVRGGQRLDMNYTVRHVGKKTRSEMRASTEAEVQTIKDGIQSIIYAEMTAWPHPTLLMNSSVRVYDDEQILDLLRRTQELERQKGVLCGFVLIVLGIASSALSRTTGGTDVQDFLSGILMGLSVAEILAGIWTAV